MGETINVPNWVFVIIAVVLLALVLAIVFWPKPTVEVDRSCPDLGDLMGRVNVNESNIVLYDEEADLAYPKVGTLTIKSVKYKTGLPRGVTTDIVTCRQGGLQLNENINYNYCDGLLITGPLTDAEGVVTEIVTRGATLVYSPATGEYIATICK